MRLLRVVVNWTVLLSALVWAGPWLLWSFATDDAARAQRAGRKWVWQ